jgi:hydrogenase maturation protein HypF
VYASQRAETIKVAVQHHHAHVVSAMTEHGVEGPAIGIAYDGTGYGTDGTMWGGEVLLATVQAFRRIATFRPLLLAGGDRAIREPWRLALALVIDAYDDRVPPNVWRFFSRVPLQDIDAVRGLLNRAPMPLARGVGRYFDAFGALFLGRPRASFEGQIALEWNQVADPAVVRAYPFAVDEDAHECREIDLRPAVRAAVSDAVRGDDAAAISAAFHNTIAKATGSVVRRAIAQYGSLPVVASGGCFQNARLAESVKAALAPEHHVLFQELVPPGDGGIALGQAVIADALTAAG